MSRAQPTGGACLRHPQRISITLPQHVFEAMLRRSAEQGRSLSNLGAYLLELSLEQEGIDPDSIRYTRLNGS